MNPPVGGDGCIMRVDSAADNFRQRNYWDTGNCQRSPSFCRDWHHNNFRGNHEPPDRQ